MSKREVLVRAKQGREGQGRFTMEQYERAPEGNKYEKVKVEVKVKADNRSSHRGNRREEVHY